MRPEPIDSAKEILPGPQILMEFARRYDTGEYPMYAVIAGLAQELSMDDAEVIQFGNTAFVSHYDMEEASVYMRALNVDTAPNFINNIENYVAYVYGRGIKLIVTNYSDATVSSAIKTVKRRIETNNKNLEASLSFEQEDGETIATIELTKEGDK